MTNLVQWLTLFMYGFLFGNLTGEDDPMPLVLCAMVIILLWTMTVLA